MKIYQQPRSGVEYEMEEFRRLSQDMVRLTRNGYAVEVVVRDLLRWELGAYAQDAFLYLDDDQREFLITGMTPDEFAAAFPAFPGEE